MLVFQETPLRHVSEADFNPGAQELPLGEPIARNLALARPQ